MDHLIILNQLLIAKDPHPKQSSKANDRALFTQLRKINPDGSVSFLEHLVLKKRDKVSQSAVL
jgi:hypothetical protein